MAPILAHDIHQHSLQLLPRYRGGVAGQSNIQNAVLHPVGCKDTSLMQHIQDVSAPKGALQRGPARVLGMSRFFAGGVCRVGVELACCISRLGKVPLILQKLCKIQPQNEVNRIGARPAIECPSTSANVTPIVFRELQQLVLPPRVPLLPCLGLTLPSVPPTTTMGAAK